MPRTASRSCRGVTMSLLPLVEFFKAEWPSSAAVWLPDGQPPKPGTLYRTPGVADTYKRILAEAKAAGGDRERQIEAARDAFYRGFVAEAIDRFATRTPQMDGSGRRNVAPADRRRHGALARDLEEDGAATTTAATASTRPAPGVRGRCCCSSWRCLKGFDLAALDPERRRVRACRHRMLQARLRRSRGVLWRSGIRRSAAGDAAERRLQRCAPRADRQGSLAGAAARIARAFGTAP